MTILSVARGVVLATFVVALFAATASWLVRTRRISPFNPFGRLLRQASDPIIRPMETRVVKLGGNPTQASFWLVVGAAVGGILLLSVLQWFAEIALAVKYAASGGARGMAVLVVEFAYRVVWIALLVRVVASWFGRGRYSRWLRPAYVLTDWIVEPLRRVVPPFGSIDVTPLVALLLLWLLKQFVMVVLL